jgi:ABC-type nitrate/sulfonate/bicarbonate transport system permease component
MHVSLVAVWIAAFTGWWLAITGGMGLLRAAQEKRGKYPLVVLRILVSGGLIGFAVMSAANLAHPR